jgi:hypothetical protein
MAATPLLLTREEIEELTGRKQPAAQVRWLSHAGWKFARDSDGYPTIAREEFQRNMIGTTGSAGNAPADPAEFEVNLDALQQLRGVA